MADKDFSETDDDRSGDPGIIIDFADSASIHQIMLLLGAAAVSNLTVGKS